MGPSPTEKKSKKMSTVRKNGKKLVLIKKKGIPIGRKYDADASPAKTKKKIFPVAPPDLVSKRIIPREKVLVLTKNTIIFKFV